MKLKIFILSKTPFQLAFIHTTFSRDISSLVFTKMDVSNSNDSAPSPAQISTSESRNKDESELISPRTKKRRSKRPVSDSRIHSPRNSPRSRRKDGKNSKGKLTNSPLPSPQGSHKRKKLDDSSHSKKKYGVSERREKRKSKGGHQSRDTVIAPAAPGAFPVIDNDVDRVIPPDSNNRTNNVSDHSDHLVEAQSIRDREADMRDALQAAREEGRQLGQQEERGRRGEADNFHSEGELANDAEKKKQLEGKKKSRRRCLFIFFCCCCFISISAPVATVLILRDQVEENETSTTFQEESAPSISESSDVPSSSPSASNRTQTAPDAPSNEPPAATNPTYFPVPSTIPSQGPTSTQMDNSDSSAAPTDLSAEGTPAPVPTIAPTPSPTPLPTEPQTGRPSNDSSTFAPTKKPTAAPTKVPTRVPTKSPSRGPTAAPTKEILPGVPTSSPVSLVPSTSPSNSPSLLPSISPSVLPSEVPSVSPTQVPSETPSLQPSLWTCPLLRADLMAEFGRVHTQAYDWVCGENDAFLRYEPNIELWRERYGLAVWYNELSPQGSNWLSSGLSVCGWDTAVQCSSNDRINAFFFGKTVISLFDSYQLLLRSISILMLSSIICRLCLSNK